MNLEIKRTDFIYSDNVEPHCLRRKELISKYGTSINKLFGHEPLTKYIVVGLISLQLYLAHLFNDDILNGGTITMWITTYVLGATITQALFLAIHEISHNLAFKNTVYNKLFGIFTNIPIIFPMFIMFKEYHQDHHKYQGDNLDTDIPTYFEAKLLSSRIGKIFFLFNQTWFYAFRPLFVKQPKLTIWHLLNLCVQLIADYLLIYYIGWGAILYLFACMHISGSIHPCAAHFIAEHYVFSDQLGVKNKSSLFSTGTTMSQGCFEQDNLSESASYNKYYKFDDPIHNLLQTETYSYYGSLNKLCFNVGYHNEHHDFPNIAWSSLPKLHAIAKEDYNKLPSHKSWIKVIWDFITLSHMSLFDRIKRNMK
jgi:sphingolipid delta-4 desaturase